MHGRGNLNSGSPNKEASDATKLQGSWPNM